MNPKEALLAKKTKLPQIIVDPPGPKSKKLHSKATKYMKGYSSQVRI